MLILLAVYVLSTLVDVNAFQRSFGLKLSKTAITSSSLQASIIGPNEVDCVRSLKPIISNSSPHIIVANEGITLPSLSKEDEMILRSNKRLQNQKRTGRQGYGWVAVDVKASPEQIFTALEDFKGYEEKIPTVRSAKILSCAMDTAVVEYNLSRFKLPVNVIQTVYKKKRLIRFKLDPSRPNSVVSNVDGFWYVGSTDREEYSRVWLYANIVVSRLVPSFIVDYAAYRALPRATEWLQSYFSDSEIINEL